MYRDLLVGAGAGATSALFWFAFPLGLSGGLLFAYFAPFPLLLSGLNLGMRPLNIAVAVGVVTALGAVSPLAAGLFAATIALPSWIIVRQALLGQVADEAEGGGTTWFPVGHILSMIAALGAALIVLVAATHMGLEGGLKSAVNDLLEKVLSSWFAGSGGADGSTIERHWWVPFFPAVSVASWILMMVVNAVLAQTLLTRLGRNIRPTPAYSALSLPDWLSWAMIAAAAVSLIGSGDLQYVARNVTIVLAVPFFFLGLGLVHTAARRLPQPTIMLVVFYLILLFFGWPLLAVAGLGFFEQWVGLRGRIAGGHANDEEEE